MAFANSSYSDVLATTIESRSGTVADNVTNNNALLVRFFERESDPDVIGRAFRLMTDTPQAELQDTLVAMLSRDLDPQLLETLVVFLTNRRVSKAVPALWTLLKDDTRPKRVRDLACMSLRQLGGPKDVKELQPYLEAMRQERKQQNSPK